MNISFSSVTSVFQVLQSHRGHSVVWILPVYEVSPPAVSVDSGQSLQTAGDMRGERGLADIFQALQLTNENPLGKKNNQYIYIYFFFQYLTKSQPVIECEQRYTAEFWSKLWLISSAYLCGSQSCLWCDRLVAYEMEAHRGQ